MEAGISLLMISLTSCEEMPFAIFLQTGACTILRKAQSTALNYNTNKYSYTYAVEVEGALLHWSGEV